LRREHVAVACRGTRAARRLDVEARPEPLEYGAMMLSLRDHVLQRGLERGRGNAKMGRPAAPHPRLVDQRLADVEANRPDSAAHPARCANAATTSS
jgi:hypothetical protein